SIHGWIVHLYWIAPVSATSGCGIFQLCPAGTVWLYSALLLLVQKKLCGTGAGFLTTIVSPTRAVVMWPENMQHGWSMTTSAGFRLASAGLIWAGSNLALGLVLSGRSQTTTFLIPRFFGLTT